jgi:hypothetical protein
MFLKLFLLCLSHSYFTFPGNSENTDDSGCPSTKSMLGHSFSSVGGLFRKSDGMSCASGTWILSILSYFCSMCPKFPLPVIL